MLYLDVKDIPMPFILLNPLLEHLVTDDQCLTSFDITQWSRRWGTYPDSVFKQHQLNTRFLHCLGISGSISLENATCGYLRIIALYPKRLQGSYSPLNTFIALTPLLHPALYTSWHANSPHNWYFNLLAALGRNIFESPLLLI